LVICNGKAIDWRHVANGKLYKTPNINEPGLCGRFASDDNSVIALNGFNKLSFYNFKDGTFINSITSAEQVSFSAGALRSGDLYTGKDPVMHLSAGALNSDGSIAAIPGIREPVIRLYEVKSGKLIHCLKNQFLTQYQNLLLDFALNDRLLKVVVRDARGKSTSSLWDVKSGKCIHCLEGVCHLSLSSDSRLAVGCKDSENSVCVWSIDENLENYLSKEISIDQALLLLLAFKNQKNDRVIIEEASKLKTVCSSIAHKGLRDVLSNFFKCTRDWVIQDETEKIAEDYQIKRASPAHFIGDRTWADETEKLQSPHKKRKLNHPSLKK
jgi:WD40 repeat protein